MSATPTTSVLRGGGMTHFPIEGMFQSAAGGRPGGNRLKNMVVILYH
jgi:hypothetical protein